MLDWWSIAAEFRLNWWIQVKLVESGLTGGFRLICTEVRLN